MFLLFAVDQHCVVSVMVVYKCCHAPTVKLRIIVKTPKEMVETDTTCIPSFPLHRPDLY